MSKYSPEIKFKACKDYFFGKISHKEMCMEYGIHFCEKICQCLKRNDIISVNKN